MSNYFPDKHTVYVTELGPTRSNQLDQAIGTYITLCSTKFNKPKDFWGKWYINLLGNGVAYVFFEKTPAYYLMINRDINGDEFYHEVVNPEYEAWEKNEEDFFSAPLDLSASPSWSDISDAPPKTIKTPFEDGQRLINFPVIKLDEAQKRICNKSVIEVCIRACVAREVGDDVMRNVLFACNVPSHITQKDIEDHFKRFSTSKVHKVPTVVITKQRDKTDYEQDSKKYTSNKKQSAYNKVEVKFDSSTRDASFALIMCKRTEIKGNKISFDYCKQSRNRGYSNKGFKTHEEKAMESMYFG